MGCIQKFSEPGSDGALPDGFKEWQWGAIYTVRPELLSPLVRGREYRIAASTRRRVAKDQEFAGYEELYRHAAWMASARLSDLTCADAMLTPSGRGSVTASEPRPEEAVASVIFST